MGLGTTLALIVFPTAFMTMIAVFLVFIAITAFADSNVMMMEWV